MSTVDSSETLVVLLRLSKKFLISESTTLNVYREAVKNKDKSFKKFNSLCIDL